jgi:uncharacterized membrane protein YqjE
MSHVHEPQRAREPKHAHALPEQLVDPQEASLGTLVSDLSSQIPELIRSEMRLAQAEVAEKGKRAGIGIGMFSVAGLMGFFGFAVLLATFVLLLDLVLPAWAAALIVAVALFAIAGVAALVGKKKVDEVGSPTPERALSGIKQDVATVKGERR